MRNEKKVLKLEGHRINLNKAQRTLLKKLENLGYQIEITIKG